MMPFDVVQVDVTDVHGNQTIIYLHRQNEKGAQILIGKRKPP